MTINETHIDLLSRAFENDPMFIHLLSNKYRSKKLIRFILKQNRLLDGLVLTDDMNDPSYVAIVDRPRNLRHVSIWAKVKLNIEMFLLLFRLPFHVLRFLTNYQKTTFSIAPNQPHYYITMIGVDPSHQGKGIGKKVLREIHEIAESSQPAYPVALDTENQQNVAFYERVGYELMDTKIIDGLEIYCMRLPVA
ncbi:GNAT family N-acetyltransferase [Gracilibacillus kekensis]|uniref:Acetyltransferase (GNAT) family protein n=1 Tax=Gracilibacillus kekensis TaxID=1027249 RepID=A0A1M7Q9U0_9BACI|nr:N-acetyltransferase [Gracilibacillus kekensis]SHN27350.1 Acetyltransferase (GNAT) family protein [Gracilibacillus kekensis]